MPQTKTAQQWADWAKARTRQLLANGSSNVHVSALRTPNRDFSTEMLMIVRNTEIRYHSPLELYLKTAKVAIGGKSGNCFEMQAVALSLLYRQGVYPLRAFCFPIDKGDHCFLVIGTADNEVVCDPWANDAYPSHQFPAKMNALYGNNPPNLNDLQILCEVQEAGSDDAYERITRDQPVPDSMDISID